MIVTGPYVNKMVYKSRKQIQYNHAKRTKTTRTTTKN
jgi:hypothetical protein